MADVEYYVFRFLLVFCHLKGSDVNIPLVLDNANSVPIHGPFRPISNKLDSAKPLKVTYFFGFSRASLSFRLAAAELSPRGASFHRTMDVAPQGWALGAYTMPSQN